MSATLTRTTLGRLAAYSDAPVTDISEAWDASDFENTTGLGFTVSVVSSKLRLSAGAAASTRVARLAGISVADVYMQAVCDGPVSGGCDFGLAARVGSTLSSSIHTAMVYGKSPTGYTGNETLAERSGGATVQSDTNASKNYTKPDMRCTLAVSGTAADYEVLKSPGGVANLTGLALTDAGAVGLYLSTGGAVNLDYAEWYVMRGQTLTVTNLPAGYTVDVLDASDAVLASGAESGGSASVALGGVTFPAARKVRITDAASTVVLTETPTEGVWGGDVWAFAPVTLDLALETIFGGTAVPSPTLALTAGVALDVRGDGYVDRGSVREDPRLWRKRTTRAAGLSDFTVAPLATLAEDRLVTLAGEYLETL